MKLRYVGSSIKEFNYKNEMNQSEELEQRSGIGLNIGLNKEETMLHLEVSTEAEQKNDNDDLSKKAELIVLYFFEVDNPNSQLPATLKGSGL